MVELIDIELSISKSILKELLIDNIIDEYQYNEALQELEKIYEKTV